VIRYVEGGRREEGGGREGGGRGRLGRIFSQRVIGYVEGGRREEGGKEEGGGRLGRIFSQVPGRRSLRQTQIFGRVA
jgi:hypothetical protein